MRSARLGNPLMNPQTGRRMSFLFCGHSSCCSLAYGFELPLLSVPPEGLALLSVVPPLLVPAPGFRFRLFVCGLAGGVVGVAGGWIFMFGAAEGELGIGTGISVVVCVLRSITVEPLFRLLLLK